MVGVEAVTAASKRKKALGRPGGRPASREEILEAAERHFAERGYAAANLREIAFDAGVTQAMVKYYFGSKLDMFKEVYLQRGRALADERMSGLEAVTRQPDFSIEDVILAYLTPSFKLRDTAQGRAFLRLQARLHAESDDTAYELRREAYDRPVRAYVATLLQLLPNLSEEAIYRRFAQLIGIYIYIVSDMHRIEEISGVKRVLPASETLVDEIVVFAAAGFRG